MSWQLDASNSCWASVNDSLGTLARMTASNGWSWATSVGSGSPPTPPEPSMRGAVSVLTSISFSRSALTSSACSPVVPSMSNTWALPRACVKPSATLLIARRSPEPASGVNSAANV